MNGFLRVRYQLGEVMEALHVDQLECETIEPKQPDISLFSERRRAVVAGDRCSFGGAAFLIGIAAQACQSYSAFKMCGIFRPAKRIDQHQPSKGFSSFRLPSECNLLL